MPALSGSCNSCLHRSKTLRNKLRSRSDNFRRMRLHQVRAARPKKTDVKKITPTDPTRPPSSTRAVTQRVRPVTVQAWSCRGWAVPYTRWSERGPGGGRRRATAGRLQRPPKSQFRRFCWEIAFSGAGGRRVCVPSGLFDVGPCPTFPGVCAGRVAWRGAAREAAPSSRQNADFKPHAQSSGVAWRARTSLKMVGRGSFHSPEATL